MTPLDYLNQVSRTLSQFAFSGGLTATKEEDVIHPGGATSPTDFHGDVHARSYRVTFAGVPGEFALSLLSGVNGNKFPMVRIGLFSVPRMRPLSANAYMPAGTDDDEKRLDGVLRLVLSSGSPSAFRDVT